MLALGDSYTIGESVEMDERWPHQLIKQLRSMGVSAEYPDYIATTGWTTRNLLGWIETRLPDDKEYDLVSILIGVNNQYQGMDIGSYEPDLRNIIDIALEVVKQDSSRLMILSIPDYAYTPFGGGNTTISQEIDAYNEIKRRVAKEYGIVYIYITDISREGLDNPSLVAADGLHPSKEQYRRWVQTIVPRLSLPINLSAKEQGHMDNDPIQFYPNPAGSLLHMNASMDIDRIRIYNLLGQMVLDFGVKSLPARIDLSHLERGAYTLCAHQGEAKDILCRTLLINL
jgi:lysophospholipase L1-like esterase